MKEEQKQPESKSLGQVYQDKVVHLIGAGTGYIGVIDSDPHPLGWGWIRINHACIVAEMVQGNNVNVALSRLGGPEKVYSTTVDIFVGDLCIEVRVLTEDGGLMKTYERQMESVFSILVAPSSAEAMSILGSGQKH